MKPARIFNFGKQHIITIISIILSVSSVGYIVSGLDFKATTEAFLEVNSIVFLWSLFVVILLFFIQGWRTWILLGREATLRSSTTSLFIGYLASMILPLRLGEVLRVALLKRNDDISAITGASMVALSQVLDVTGILLMGSLLFLFESQLRQFLPVAAVFSGAALLIVLISGWFVHQSRATVFTQNERIQAILSRIAEGLRALDDPPSIIWSAILTFAYWIGLSYSTWVLLVDLSGQATIALAIAISFASGIGRALPALPGSIGTVDISIFVVLQIFGIERDVAAALVLLIRIRYILSTGLLGIGALLLENLSMYQVIQIDRSEK